MPLFDFKCCECGKKFEFLVRESGESVTCPQCQATSVTKLVSAFAMAGGKGHVHSGPGPCGSCGDPRGPGSCHFDD
ncbi:MAG: zinc ribbon domain-containing protein [Acidobacteria bacterium]|nr:zinc ribbon domain-containing protein [Acidobacteriota bacterium]MCB9396768.1 zinc ribbon domain-containing protein [Acidobacteriota bacterium]